MLISQLLDYIETNSDGWIHIFEVQHFIGRWNLASILSVSLGVNYPPLYGYFVYVKHVRLNEGQVICLLSVKFTLSLRFVYKLRIIKSFTIQLTQLIATVSCCCYHAIFVSFDYVILIFTPLT